MHVQNLTQIVENQFETRIKCNNSDNGPGFFLKDLFATKGIIHHTSCVCTPQQNGCVERKHQHILNIAHALMFQSQLPKYLWSYAIKQSVFLINRIPSPVTNKQTPYELLHNRKPDFSMLKVFGSLCYSSTNEPHQKFDPRSGHGVFLGFQTRTKGHVILDF